MPFVNALSTTFRAVSYSKGGANPPAAADAQPGPMGRWAPAVPRETPRLATGARVLGPAQADRPNHATPRPGRDGIGRRVFDAMAERVRHAGEPWITFFEPSELAREMLELGFGEMNDLDHAEIHARYLLGRADGLRVGSLARLASARVTAARVHPPGP